MAVSAQERVSEIRRERANNVSTDAESQATGIAPSFAALWLLQSAGNRDEPEVNNPSKTSSPSLTNSPRSNSNASPLSSPMSKFSNLFSASNNNRTSMDSNVNSTSSPQTGSVLNRPRNRAPKPTEMGGVTISQGKLIPDSPTVVEDTRSTLPRSVSGVQVGESPTKRNPSSSSSITPSSPTSLTSGKSSTSSKDKPAPVKSALKNRRSLGGLRTSKSLADTLFSLPMLGNSAEKELKKEEKKEKEKEKIRRGSVGAKSPPSTWSGKESKVAKLEKKASQKELKLASVVFSSTSSPISTSKPTITSTSPPTSPSTSYDIPVYPSKRNSSLKVHSPTSDDKGKAREIQSDEDQSRSISNLSTLDTLNVALLSPSLSSSSPNSPTEQFSTPLASPSLEDGKNNPIQFREVELKVMIWIFLFRLMGME